MQRKTIPQRKDSIAQQHASAMRHAPTRSEEALWRALFSKQLGLSFRRQVVIGRRIADFVAPSVKLVVEVDGGYHRDRGWLEAQRDDALRRAGYRVLHLPAELVLGDLRQAVAVIRAALYEGA